MEGTAEAGALTGIGAMRSVLIAVIVESMMTGTTIMRVGAGDAGARVLNEGEDEAAVEVLEEGGTVILSEMAVRRGVPELSSGIGRKKSKDLEIRLILRETTMVVMGTQKKRLANFMSMSRKSKNSNLLRRDIDLFMLLWFVFSPFCLPIHLVLGTIFYSSI